MMRLACLLVLVVPTLADATVIVGVRTQDEIIVGADSKRVNTDGQRGPDVCKLVVINNVAFALAGLVGRIDEGFELRSVLSNFLRQQRSIKRAVFRRMELVSAKAMADMLARSPNLRATVVSRDGYVANVVAMYFLRDGIARVQRWRLQMQLYPDRVRIRLVEREKCPGRCSDNFYRFGIGSGMAAAEAVVTSEPHFFPFARQRPGGLPIAIRRLVQAAIDTDPEACGPPIAILRLTADGARWVGPSNDCYD